MEDDLFQAVGDGGIVLGLGRRADVEAAIAKHNRATPRDERMHWRVEPWDGPPLVTSLDEPFSWFRVAACALFGFAALPLSFLAYGAATLIDLGWLSYIWQLLLFIAGPTLFAITAMQLRFRRWRRRLYWLPLGMFTTAFVGGVWSLATSGPTIRTATLYQGGVGLLLSLVAACVICIGFDRPRRPSDD